MQEVNGSCCFPCPVKRQDVMVFFLIHFLTLLSGAGRVMRWCWVNFQCRGVLLIWIRVGQGPSALAVSAGAGCLDVFFPRLSFLFFLPLSERRPDID